MHQHHILQVILPQVLLLAKDKVLIYFILHVKFIKRSSLSAFTAKNSSRVRPALQGRQKYGQASFRHFVQINQFNVFTYLHSLELSVSLIKMKKKDILRVPDFYQQTVQWKYFCIHLVKPLYEGSEPIGSQWGGVITVMRILVFGIPQYVIFSYVLI